jgi:hypothetical protein
VVLKDVLLVWILFNMLNFSVSLGVYLRNVGTTGQNIVILSWLLAVMGALMIGMSCYCIFNSVVFGQCHAVLKSDVDAKWRIAPFYPAILLLYRFLMGLLMGLVYDA